MRQPLRGLARWTPPSDSVGSGLYHFTRQRNGSEAVPHGAELSYVWRRLSDLRPPTGTAADLALSRAMVEYWLNFARAGDPNGDGATAGAQPGAAAAALFPVWAHSFARLLFRLDT